MTTASRLVSLRHRQRRCPLLPLLCTLLALAATADASTEDANLALKYRIYVLGLPTVFDAALSVERTVADDQGSEKVVVTSTLENWLVSNFHRSELTLKDCRYRPQRYHNYGFSPGWRFDDTVEYDWDNLQASYRGELQRPGQKEGVYQEFEHRLEDPATAGAYVDKLSQVFVMGCHFDAAEDDQPLLLNYLDDTLGRYRVRVVQRGKMLRMAGRDYATLQVQSAPFEATPGSIHRRVNYWLVPELGYLPALIKTKLGSLPLTVKLVDLVSVPVPVPATAYAPTPPQ